MAATLPPTDPARRRDLSNQIDHGIGGGGTLVIQRTVRDVGSSAPYPQLTHTNSWEVMMKVMLEARRLWAAVEAGDVERQEDRCAIEAILCAVPVEMQVPGDKEDGERRIGQPEDDAHRLRRGEARDPAAAAGVRTPGVQGRGRSGGLLALPIDLGDAADGAHQTIEDVDVVAKFMRAVPKRFSQLAQSIETLLDLETLSIEDAVGRFRVQEDRYAWEHSGDRLAAAEAPRGAAAGKAAGAEGDGGAATATRAGTRATDGRDVRTDGRDSKDTRDGRPDTRRISMCDRCHKCGEKGHWARYCKAPRR
ncbi:LOW QUALITY PROTEIN: hypothetical protein U9M48_019364 [Paspalum notatum var. saurae]|uniref:CCHC-type domain-containing protein n=1 Tax=Paspalum notatum var. saurae TaxID=547442 RepID=A0AAQ3WRH1_PASNO